MVQEHSARPVHRDQIDSTRFALEMISGADYLSGRCQACLQEMEQCLTKLMREGVDYADRDEMVASWLVRHWIATAALDLAGNHLRRLASERAKSWYYAKKAAFLGSTFTASSDSDNDGVS